MENEKMLNYGEYLLATTFWKSNFGYQPIWMKNNFECLHKFIS